MERFAFDSEWAVMALQTVAGACAIWDAEHAALGDLSIFEDLDWEEPELLAA